MADPSTEWISQREATELLVARARIGARQARGVLAAGLAGEPVRSHRSVAFELERVRDLAEVSPLTEEELDRVCPHGLFVARLTGPPDLGSPAAAAAAESWGFSMWTAVWIDLRIKEHGALPFVRTRGGYVVEGADVVGGSQTGPITPQGRRAYELVLRQPGPWFAELSGRRLPTGPGRSWWIRGLDRDRGTIVG